MSMSMYEATTEKGKNAAYKNGHARQIYGHKRNDFDK